MRKLVATLIAMGPTGLFTLAFLDGAGLPVPGGVDALLVFLASQDAGSAYSLALFAVVGSVLGNLVLFLLARKGGEMYLETRTTSGSAARFRRWFHHYGLLTVFIAALVPLPVMPMKIFVLCAGALESSIIAFLLVFSAARLMRYFGLAYLGSQLGTQALQYLREHVWYLVTFAVLLFLVLYLMIKMVDRIRGRAIA
jgi:membrane protein YqaA with SNARE-associated domain